MFSLENPEDRVAIVQMNSELRHAQLELLSAECATNQLRLRYSTEDISRFGDQDVLHRAIATARGLHQYYSSIPKQRSAEGAGGGSGAGKLDGEQILQAIASVADYLHKQRTYYYPLGAPLSGHHRAMMHPFFSAGLLDRIRIVELSGARIPNPDFYGEAKTLGFENLPDIQHMASVTFLDVIVFNATIADRELFHGWYMQRSSTFWEWSSTATCSFAGSCAPKPTSRCLWRRTLLLSIPGLHKTGRKVSRWRDRYGSG